MYVRDRPRVLPKAHIIFHELLFVATELPSKGPTKACSGHNTHHTLVQYPTAPFCSCLLWAKTKESRFRDYCCSPAKNTFNESKSGGGGWQKNKTLLLPTLFENWTNASFIHSTLATASGSCSLTQLVPQPQLHFAS